MSLLELCRDCYFFLKLDGQRGDCRRFPTPVRKDCYGWCGEWQPRDPKPAHLAAKRSSLP